MKKRKINKLTSLFLSLTFVLPNFLGIETVFAANNAVPTITSANYSNNKVSLQWDTPIPSSDIFLTQTLDSYYMDASTSYNSGTFNNASPYGNGWLYNRDGSIRPQNDAVRNSMKLIDNVGVNNSRGFIWRNTIPNGGWGYDHFSSLGTVNPAPNVIINDSNAGWGGWNKMQLNKPIIMRVQAKGTGDFWTGINPGWVGNSQPYGNITWAENLSSSDYLYRLQNGIPIKINNPSGYVDGNVHHATALCNDYTYNYYFSWGHFYQESGQWYYKNDHWYGVWSSGRPEQPVAGSNRNVTTPVIGQPFYQMTHGYSPTATISNVNTSDWQYYSANTNIPLNAESQAIRGYYTMYSGGRTPNTLQVDNLQFGYAPLSRVYRDGQLVMNNSYTVEFVDNDAKDNVAPNAPTLNSSISGNNINLSWNVVQDIGNTYNYQITSINTGGEESARSTTKTVNAISGLKHYEIYVNNQLHGTTTNTSYTLPNNFETNNIQVKAVDNVGNKSGFSNTINQFKLQSVKTNNGVQLDWNYGSETNNSAYKIYRKDNHTDEFQPIQAKETVKVLEIYPNISSLSNWVRDYGQGKITCDSIPIETFNNNPNIINNYDVIVFGFWDSNLGKDIGENTVQIIENFLNSGRGVLFGHDTIRSTFPNFAKLAPYVNMLPSGGPAYVVEDKIRINKKGLLTKYPYDIGDIGTILTIPPAHALGQVANGENWMTFNTSNQYYLTTWNNAAMIQTGHSNGQATEDEQKLIMNTLFSLAQLTNATSWLDRSAIDIDGPTIPTITNIVSNGNNATVHFNKSTDRGTTYDYKISTNKNNTEVFTNISTQTITSGMKTYEIYINDELVGMTGENSYNFTIPNVNESFSVKVVAVDNAGNKSDNAYEKDGGIKLTATPNPQENYIKLDWTKPSVDQDYTYMVYQKRPDSEEFQTIPTKDKIKVLNIYPTSSAIPNETFTNWKGETFTIPKSANLKRWIEEPNAEHPKGYGQGLIDVDIISIQEFNANPNILWNYDVAYQGHWDANAGVGNNILNDNALNVISQFIDNGRGFLGGHDSIGYEYGNTSLSKLRNKFNIKIGYWSTPLPDVDFNQKWGKGGNRLSVVKNGLLTNYPWKIGNNLSVPTTHSTSNMAFGDIWMNIEGSYDWGNPPTGYEQYSGYYLTTWNNTAMIQAGHSNGNATADEQKLLANTLFYLAQVTTANTWNDRMGQDVTNPTKPTINTSSVNGSQSKVTFTINPSTDNGTTYQYYVEGKGLSDGKTYLSDTVVTTITTGLKGYSYVIDNNPNTIPDNIIETTGTTITQNVNLTKPVYLHIVAVDNAGNTSEPLHYVVEDKNAPTATHTINPNTWTNQNVTITVTASDIGYGVKRIKLPNGTYVNSHIVNYTVSENGTYNFVIEDYADNTTNYPVTITNIDKINPTGSFTINNGASQTNNRNVELKINYDDNLSGVYKIVVSENGTSREYSPTSSPFITTWTLSPSAGNKAIYVTLYDRAGNTITLTNSIIYTNLEIQNFILTNVVNPKVYNANNPFMPKSWVFNPQLMSAGGNISFQLTLSNPVDLPDYTDTVNYKLKLTHENGYNVILNGGMINTNGLTYSSKVMIPKNTPKGTKVELLVTATRQTPEFIETVYFPTKTSNIDFAHIGNVTNNINEEIRFNEIK